MTPATHNLKHDAVTTHVCAVAVALETRRAVIAAPLSVRPSLPDGVILMLMREIRRIDGMRKIHAEGCALCYLLSCDLRSDQVQEELVRMELHGLAVQLKMRDLETCTEVASSDK